MKRMKRLLGLAVMAGAAMTAGTASAEAEFSGNVALTSDYVFRGVSQSDSEVAIQGGFDYANSFANGVGIYAGLWGSSIDFGLDGTTEVDVYAGIKPELGPVTLDFGVIGYLYPGLDADAAAEADYVEFKAGAGISPAENFSLGAALYYSPNFTFTTGDDSGLYVEVNGGYTFNDYFAVSAAVGNQSVDVNNYYGTSDEYTTWNIGGTISAYGFGLDLRYFDTDLSPDLVGPSGDDVSDGRFVATLKRAL